jgi:DNA-binding NarL/FixJ family response regulator
MKPTKPAAPASSRQRILVVDDHPMTREGIAHLIRHEAGLAVAGEVGTARAALAAVKRNPPDLVLADLSLEERSGLDLIKDLHVLHPAIPVLVFSMHYESLYAERAIRAGARGYIMKSEGAARLLDAIRSVLSGNVHLSEAMRDRAVFRFTHGPAAVKGDNAAALSDRELEVFHLVGQALGTQDIATRLQISTSTVETHRAHLKQKLGLRTATELVRAAVEWHERGKG